jgi:hypothetical protein
MPSTLSEALAHLSSFPDIRQPPPELFGSLLRSEAVTAVPIVAERKNLRAAELYAEILDIRRKMRLIEVDDGVLPSEAALEEEGSGVFPLFIDSAINPTLKDRFFENPSMAEIAYFVDHQYTPRAGHASPELHTVGTTVQGLRMLPDYSNANGAVGLAVRERAGRMRAVLGDDVLPYEDFRAILRSPAVRAVDFHALGPAGTNIARASSLYLEKHDLFLRSHHEIHSAGVEPPQYAEAAARSKRPGIVPLHMECAVYYGMQKLDADRPHETTFADHEYMPLIAMQLASPDPTLKELGRRESVRIASHPSPLPLIHSLLDDGLPVTYVKASSNSAAAQMVERGEADACITTETARQTSRLHLNRLFGSPAMIFTVATPLNREELRAYQQSL